MRRLNWGIRTIVTVTSCNILPCKNFSNICLAMAISVNLSLNVSLGGFQIFTGTDSTHVLDKFILTQNVYFSVKI